MQKGSKLSGSDCHGSWVQLQSVLNFLVDNQWDHLNMDSSILLKHLNM